MAQQRASGGGRLLHSLPTHESTEVFFSLKLWLKDFFLVILNKRRSIYAYA